MGNKNTVQQTKRQLRKPEHSKPRYFGPVLPGMCPLPFQHCVALFFLPSRLCRGVVWRGVQRCMRNMTEGWAPWPEASTKAAQVNLVLYVIYKYFVRKTLLINHTIAH
jgi:hypothetical protein